MNLIERTKNKMTSMAYKIMGISWRDLLITAIPIALLIVGVSWITLHLLSPAPPKEITILGGPAGSSFQLNAQRYAKIISTHGVKVNVIETDGSDNNLEILQDKKKKADVGLVQNDSSLDEKEQEISNLMSLGTVWVQPLLVLYRGDEDISYIKQLKGKRVALAPEETQIHQFVDQVMLENGMKTADMKTVILEPEDGIHALVNNKVDAIFLTGELVTVERIHEIMEIPHIKIMSFQQAAGYTRAFRFLSEIDIPEGGFDLGRNVPNRDTKLIGTSVELIARDSLHPALSDLMIEAARQVNGKPNMFRGKNEFPKLTEHTIPISEEAKRYFVSGAPFLYKKLPFWLASILDRIVILMLPLVIVLVPASKVIGPIYRWRMRSKIYKWYGALMKIEHELNKKLSKEEGRTVVDEINEIQERVNQVNLPLAFANELYALREHIEYVKSRCHALTAK
jgi:TRAP transporter TAXI family solute receptor